MILKYFPFESAKGSVGVMQGDHPNHPHACSMILDSLGEKCSLLKLEGNGLICHVFFNISKYK